MYLQKYNHTVVFSDDARFRLVCLRSEQRQLMEKIEEETREKNLVTDALHFKKNQLTSTTKEYRIKCADLKDAFDKLRILNDARLHLIDQTEKLETRLQIKDGKISDMQATVKRHQAQVKEAEALRQESRDQLADELKKNNAIQL